jgi:tRNA dimethylallyltransferase
MTNPLIVILGPTASGKTRLAAHLAYELNGEIISADSRQVYRGMDIGTGKDIGEYTVNDRRIPFHLIDIADPGYEYNVFEFQRDFRRAFDEITGRGCLPVLCGGTGLYLESVLLGYRMPGLEPDPIVEEQLESLTDKELADILRAHRNVHNITDLTDRDRLIKAVRIALTESLRGAESEVRNTEPFLVFGIHTDREILRQRITERLHARLDAGMVDEVRRLIAGGVLPEVLSSYGLEYKFITAFLTGTISREEMVRKLNIAIHQFAKRQMTWFRRMEKRGIPIHWLDSGLMLQEMLQEIISTASGNASQNNE